MSTAPGRLVLIACALASVTPAPARVASAQGVFDMGALTNTMAQGAIVNSERDRARRIKGGRRPRRPVVNKSVLLYKPNLAARKRNLALFAASIEKVDPTSAKSLRAAFAKGDIIAEAGKAMRAAGLNTNNLADAMSAYLVNAWHGTRGSTDGTKAQFRAVSNQLAEVVASTPALARTSNAVKQQAAEGMILNALLVDATVSNAKKNPSTMPAVRAAVGQGARAAFGFDLTMLNLGANGLSKK